MKSKSNFDFVVCRKLPWYGRKQYCIVSIVCGIALLAIVITLAAILGTRNKSTEAPAQGKLEGSD